MKKLIYTFLAFLLTIPIAMAQGDKEVKITSVTDAPPGEVSVKMQFLNISAPIEAVSIRFNYDADILVFNEYEWLVDDAGLKIVNTKTPGIVIISYAAFTGFTEDDFLEFTFEYRGGFDTTLDFIEEQTEIMTSDNVEIEIEKHTSGEITKTLAYKDGTLTLGTESAVPGDNVTLPLTITDDGGFDGEVNAMTLYVQYDQEKLTYLSYSDELDGFNNGIGHDSDNGIITLEYSADPPLSFNGSINAVDLNFTYDGGGFADVEFLPGSHAAFVGVDGEILIAEFVNGGVGLQSNIDGTLRIEKVLTSGAEVLSNPGDLDPNDPGFDGAIEPDPVMVDVFAEDITQNFNEVSLQINYDQNLLEYKGFDIGSVPNWTTESHDPDTGTLIFTRTDENDFALEDVLLTLKFDYLYVDPEDDAVDYFDSQADITFLPGTILGDIDNGDINYYMPELEDGWVRLILPGDVTCSGSVGVPDILAAIDYFMNGTPLPCFINGDITGDGDIKVPDILGIIDIFMDN